jgi:hypothetical protein
MGNPVIINYDFYVVQEPHSVWTGDNGDMCIPKIEGCTQGLKNYTVLKFYNTNYDLFGCKVNEVKPRSRPHTILENGYKVYINKNSNIQPS